ncbi:histidine phosphatase family protein [Bacillus cereus]|uniref:Histidine phosphatase family protein n=2 Tax=Bacillus cereus group TaxID=86661 RepID=A0AB34CZI3_BACCE|nr:MULTISPECIES: histidine phosphatase family protein [Bacillus cereus group]HDR5350634.1 histidine phosphatase family protein [Bacillus thuringiensis]KAB2491259.1 histidine phosphatase family protein [Bacillus cereus]MBY0130331.1 histidine phosphatase family protein [Bacillus cereus]MCH5458631.1 histidine phosphatase family protein [Bacillus cereus]MDA1970468.1 histidine phosphatase family protein [Bacillus cereus]
MKISFIRHGRLDCTIEPMTVTSFHEWIKGYDLHTITEKQPIPLETREAVEVAKLIVTSDQKCAVQSATELMDSLCFIQNSLFREAAVPASFYAPKWLKCKLNVWMCIGRALWILGYHKNVESYKEVRERARQAAYVLHRYALVHGSIALVGHNYFNSMIGTELRAMGWFGSPILHRKPWGCTTYTFHEAMDGNILNTNLT